MSTTAKDADYSDYPCIKNYSISEGISEDVLAQAFEIEHFYHEKLLSENDFQKRQLLYSEFYSKLLTTYGRHEELFPRINPKDQMVRLFAHELENRSVIDFGCGQGYMLQSIAKNLSTGKLRGVDVYIPDALKKYQKVDFVDANIVNYVTEEPFDVAVSDNVVEHLVPADAKIHIDNIYQSLSEKGKFILIMPNKLFGPADITRIKDFSHSGKIEAMGGHVNESTYSEMIAILKAAGFRNFSTVLPVPKFKYTFLRRFRVGTAWVRAIENSRFLLWIFRHLKVNGVCPVRFTITLIAEK